MKIAEGMYVRTKEGNIEKICAIENEHIYTDDDYLSWYPSSIAFIKASHNIKELLQVGDIISYEFPTGVGMAGYENVTILPELLNTLQNGENNHEYHIKSIVTKEQFEAMQYKVVEEC